MTDESPVDGKRLVELFKKASELAESEREALVRSVRTDDPRLAASLEELLEQPASLAERITHRYGSEVDPHISLEPAESSEAASDQIGAAIRTQSGD